MKLDFCVVCGKKEDLHQHHIFPIVLSDNNRNTDNETITVCGYHHKLIHGLQQHDKFNHRHLTIEGLNKARKKGIKLGRRSKTNDQQKEEIIDKLIKGISVSSLSREYNISRATIINIRETFNAKKKYSYDWEREKWNTI